MKDLEDLDWEDIIDTLKSQKCTLFIGNGAYQAPGGGSLHSALEKHLDVRNTNHPYIQQYNSDGFFLFKKERFKRKVIEATKEFYNQDLPETQKEFELLAQVPFNIIVSLSPDNILARTYDSLGFDYSSDFYFMNRKATDNFEKPSANKPLIYNLLGNIEEPESLVLTHSDFFEYLGSVFKGNSMNEDLRNELEGAYRYIFVGLPFEKWYFQLLLRVLSLHSDKLKEVERLALKSFEDDQLRSLYNEEFKIDFIPTESSSFISVLFEKCKEAKILKEVPKTDPLEEGVKESNPDLIRQLIADAKTKEALLHTKVLINRKTPRDKKLDNDIIVLKNQYNFLKQREMRGTIYAQDVSVENNIVVEKLLELVTKIESK